MRWMKRWESLDKEFSRCQERLRSCCAANQAVEVICWAFATHFYTLLRSFEHPHLALRSAQPPHPLCATPAHLGSQNQETRLSSGFGDAWRDPVLAGYGCQASRYVQRAQPRPTNPTVCVSTYVVVVLLTSVVQRKV